MKKSNFCLYMPPVSSIGSYREMVDYAVAHGIKNLETLNILDLSTPDLQLAKEDLEKLKSKRKNPQGLNTLKKPLLKADVLKNRCKSDIESLQKDIAKLEKSSTSNPHSGALYGIGFLLAIAAAIATLVFLRNAVLQAARKSPHFDKASFFCQPKG